MGQIVRHLSLLCIIALLTGCSTLEVNEYRAGCTLIDGKARYGYVQGVSGDATGAYVYIGKHLRNSVKITCNKDTQEVLYNE